MSERISPPVWVATDSALKSLVSDLMRQSRIAVDTESNSLHAYREQVCLIQFSTPAADYLVDPLVLIDLSPLAPIFADPRIEKIFHAAEYDLICLRRDFGFTFDGIFDTMQAGRILGHEKVGLDAMLKKYFDVSVNKRCQKADWGMRPLAQQLLEYARLDTHYLIPLRERLVAELEAKGRWQMAMEDFRRACRLEEIQSGSLEAWERFAGRRDLSLRGLTILRELIILREQSAEKLDVPPFKVMGDGQLLAIARALPSTKMDLEAIGLKGRQLERWGEGVLSAVARGRAAPLVKRPRQERPNDRFLKRLESLKEWRKKTAAQLGVESDVVLPRPYMFSLAERGGRDLEAILASSPSRLRQYGAQILEVIGG